MGKLNVVIPATNVIVDGVEYRKVEREVQAGDIVRYDGNGYDYLPNGAFYRTYIDGDGDVVIDDEDGDASLVDERYTVFEPVFPVAQPARLTVGDYARLVNTDEIDGSSIDDWVKLGDIFEIIADDRSATPFRVKRIYDGLTHWFKAKRLVRATDEEVAAAKAALDPRNQFAKGDKVRLIAKGDRLNGYEVGKIYTVVEPLSEADRVKINGGSVPQGYAKAAELVKVTAEEIAQEAITAKWAAIGRKVNEYKRGDIVEVIKVAGGISNGHPVGTIGIVDFDTTVQGPRQGNPVITLDGMGLRCNVKLVTPVEQRFDRVG